MLEECELPYRVHGINIGAGDQFKPDFLKISPNNKIPAIVDQDGPDGKPISLFESGAILLYLAGKTGKFIPEDVRGKYDVLQWLMFQMGGVGPMLGQRLSESKYLGGADYSIADIATWPWLRSWKNQGIELSDYPKLQRWFEAIEERPAVQRAVKVLAKERPALQDDKAKEILFGATQYQRR